MIIDALKTSMLFYIRHMELYDYLAFMWLFATFFITLILVAIIIKKSPPISFFLVIVSIALFCVGPFVLKEKLNEKYRSVEIEDVNLKKLNFSNTLIATGTLHNRSQKNFTTCLVQTSIFKKNDKNYMQILKPIEYQPMLLGEPLLLGDFIEFRVEFDDFSYESDINASIKAECY
ncbi:MAG: DUF2393 family protein [Sulfurospirillaceae bacterium]|nr:DUF2393 family protein [Sulfurospirillaceae bacterium]